MHKCEYWANGRVRASKYFVYKSKEILGGKSQDHYFQDPGNWSKKCSNLGSIYFFEDWLNPGKNVSFVMFSLLFPCLTPVLQRPEKPRGTTGSNLGVTGGDPIPENSLYVTWLRAPPVPNLFSRGIWRKLVIKRQLYKISAPYISEEGLGK